MLGGERSQQYFNNVYNLYVAAAGERAYTLIVCALDTNKPFYILVDDHHTQCPWWCCKLHAHKESYDTNCIENQQQVE